MKKKYIQECFIECGAIRRPHGIKGEVLVLWNNGETPLPRGKEIFLRQGNDYVGRTLLSSRRHVSRHLIVLAGIETREEAAKLSNTPLYLREEDLLPLNVGEFYSYQILGLMVETESGEQLGTISNIFSTNAHDVYEVTPCNGDAKKSFLIPAVSSVIQNVDVSGGRMVIKMIEGLCDDAF